MKRQENLDFVVSSTSNSNLFGSSISDFSLPLEKVTFFTSANKFPWNETYIEEPSNNRFDLHSAGLYKFTANGKDALVSRHASLSQRFGEKLSVLPGAAVTFNAQLGALLILFAIVVIGYKMILVAMPYADTDAVVDFSSILKSKFLDTLHWTRENNWHCALYPILCGLAFALFSFVLVYLDSNIPGVSPPSPFSPQKKMMYRQQKNSSMHLGYITALAAGFVVSTLMFLDV